MKLWVKRDTDDDDEALKVTLADDAYAFSSNIPSLSTNPCPPPPPTHSDTSDLIQEVVRLFAFGTDNNTVLRASQVSVRGPDGMKETHPTPHTTPATTFTQAACSPTG